MKPLRFPHCSAVLVTFALMATGARAELITPDSIPNPPSAVGSADGTAIPSAGNVVTTQYTGLGLNFFAGLGGSLTAITSLNGVKVWAPATMTMSPPFVASPPVGALQYTGQWAGGYFVTPGTTNSQMASSVTLELIGNRALSVDFLNLSGQWVGGTSLGMGPHGGQLYTFSGTSRFSVIAPTIDPPGPGTPTPNPAWGVAQISFTPTPEPGSLLLAGIGALGLAASLRGRRATLRKSRIRIGSGLARISSRYFSFLMAARAD